MKKILIILVALVSFGLSANAQCIYYINSGQFKLPDGTTVTGYSGVNNSKSTDQKDQYGQYYYNNSENTNVKGKGAIPPGTYYVKGVSSSITSYTIILDKDKSNVGYNERDNDFRIHGDNSANNASKGCIILDLTSRKKIADEFNRLYSKGQYLILYVYE